MNFLGWIPALIQMGLIFGLSSIPGKNLPQFFPFADKFEHMIAYSILGALLACRPGFAEVFQSRKPSKWTSGGFLFPMLGILYGISDEIHQLFVPGRMFGIDDMAADGVGIVLGFYLLRTWDRRRLLTQKKVS